MNEISWTLRAAKQLRKLDRPQQSIIRDAVSVLAAMPSCTNVKRLSHHEYSYRLRVGNYRVMFNWHETIHVVYIEEVKKRDERTY
ncbi:type II toxin-antitoxin system RelE/ParE family toxin [Pusillimonas sp.]|uniref:type II toxin-antitoxin system RelE/ParE family toxin n=1 Tax=Pusillimonas sp. TaxID=3040095 RepID=UPI0037CAE423